MITLGLDCSGSTRIGFYAEPANHVRIGINRDSRGAGWAESKSHPLQERNAGTAIAVNLDEGRGGAFVAGGVEDHLGRESEMEGGGIRPGLGGDLIAHVGTGIRSGEGALLGQHGGKMAGFVEEIPGIEQPVRIDDEATCRQRDTGQEGIGAEWRDANGEADLLEPVEDQDCGGIEHRDEFSADEGCSSFESRSLEYRLFEYRCQPREHLFHDGVWDAFEFPAAARDEIQDAGLVAADDSCRFGSGSRQWDGETGHTSEVATACDG